MRCLVVYAHPVETSFCAAIRDRAIAALTTAGHEVRLVDLHAENFQPVMTRAERVTYETAGENERAVREHLDRIKWAEALIFVYPTWWYGLPAILKGWFDRVWVPHATFTLPTDGGPIRGLMQNIVRLVVITSAGSPWLWMLLMGSPGRMTIMRGVRALCHRRCRKLFLAHYNIDRSTPESRAAFLHRVAGALAKL